MRGQNDGKKGLRRLTGSPPGVRLARMDTPPKPRAAQSARGATDAQGREAREARALRANLARRKAQARGRDGAAIETSGAKDA